VGRPDHRLLLPPLARLCLLVLLAFAVAACGGNAAKSGDVDTPTLLAKTSERLNAVKSVHFTAAIEGAAYIDTARTIQLRSATGDIVVPDQMQAKIQIALGAANADVSLVTIGDDKYQTDLLTGRWGPAQPGFDYSPTILFDRSQGLSSVLGKLREVERAGEETVDGQAAYRLRAKVDRATIQPITSGAIEGDPVGAELWIARDSYNLLKLVLTEPKTPDKDKPAVWTLTLDKYDQPVTITRPAQ
jgi:hypothetical protein